MLHGMRTATYEDLGEEEEKLIAGWTMDLNILKNKPTIKQNWFLKEGDEEPQGEKDAEKGAEELRQEVN